MDTKKLNTRGSESGVALLYAAFGAIVAAGMVSVLLTLSKSSDRMAKVTEHGTQASYVAEGALEAGKKAIQIAIANFSPVPQGGTATIDGQVVSYTIAPTGFSAITADGSGVQTIKTGYRISSIAQVRGHQAVANRIVNINATPIFQYAVFYTADLEINPGPNMTLGGRVHSNGDMYLNSGNTLTVNSNYLRAVGHMYRHRKDNPGASSGTVQVREWVTDPFNPGEPVSYFDMLSKGQMDALGVPNVSGYDSNFVTGFDAEPDGSFFGPDDWLPWDLGALEYWDEPAGYANGTGHTVLTSEHGMSEAVTPDIGSVGMFEQLAGGVGGDFDWDPLTQSYIPAPQAGTGAYAKGYYHENAGLSIITHTDGTIEIYDAGGMTVSLPANTVKLTSMYDARQSEGTGNEVQITEIDMALLNASGAFPANGLLYAGSYGAGAGLAAHGIRLTNGSELASALTVVSENSIYIHGDYNTVNKKGSAAIADAVNLLSNAWDDSKHRGALPSASDTTYNLAMITGNHDTTPGHYNGGLENLPRFHESWSGRNARINGAFVNAWFSQHATGAWAYGSDRYKAPRRIWSYDPMFNTVANLPPFTPMTVSATDVVTY